MATIKETEAGRFSIDLELVNDKDLANAETGAMPADQVRRLTARGVVDSGATRLVIPESVAKRLGLEASGSVEVRYADGRIAERPIVERVRLTYAGRSSVFNAIVEPGRESALVGAIVLEDLDLLVDCGNQRLVPRDPRKIISEIE
jgi:predicted aspartyl protease